jgi:hypothetical protein
MKMNSILIATTLLILCNYKFVFGHCDTMDGPVIGDARKAIEQSNVNYVLKWVLPDNEKEIKDAFDLIMKVRELSPEAKELSDKYFFEKLVRIHRSGEGVPFTGIKPAGTPIDEKIKAADKSIELGNLTPLEKLVPKDNLPELKKRFEKVMSLRDFDINDVKAGREYIEAYVQFFHFAEGEEEGHSHEHSEKTGHLAHIPWILSGLFFIISIVFGVLYYKKK